MCGVVSLLVQVTVVPFVTVSVPGEKEKFVMDTACVTPVEVFAADAAFVFSVVLVGFEQPAPSKTITAAVPTRREKRCVISFL